MKNCNNLSERIETEKPASYPSHARKTGKMKRIINPYLQNESPLEPASEETKKEYLKLFSYEKYSIKKDSF